MMNSKEVICGDTTQDAWGDVKCIQAFGEETWRCHFEHLRVNGKKTLRLILHKQDGKSCIRFICLRRIQMTCEPSDSIKCGQFNDQPKCYQLVKKCSAPQSWLNQEFRYFSLYNLLKGRKYEGGGLNHLHKCFSKFIIRKASSNSGWLSTLTLRPKIWPILGKLTAAQMATKFPAPYGILMSIRMFARARY